MQILQRQFEGHQMRVIERDGQPWFVLADVCAALDLSSPHKVATRLDEDEKGRTQIPTLGGEQELTVINESGLYAVILRSDKPQAKPFRKWVTNEVLPSLRRTGTYTIGQPSNTPALITVRAIAESIGMTRGATLGRLSGMWRIPPVACGREQQPCYLFPLDAVAEALTGCQLRVPLRPYTGPILPGGLKPALEHARQGVLTRTGKNPKAQPLSAFPPAPVTDRVQAAQELVQLEQRRAQLLGALA